RNKAGTCGWIVKDCPPECSQLRDAYSCASVASCMWLEPGCQEPSIPVAGCYARTLVDCGADGHTCPGGKQCQKRTVNPCAPTYGGGAGTVGGGPTPGGGAPAPAIALPPPPQCTACAAGITICL